MSFYTLRTMAPRKLDVVQAAYRLDIADEQDWITAVGELFLDSIGHHAGFAYAMQFVDGVIVPTTVYSPDPSLVEALPGMMMSLTPEQAAIFSASLMAGSARERCAMIGIELEDTPFWPTLSSHGLVDILGTPCFDLDGQGVSLTVGVPEIFDNKREGVAWSRVSAHVAAALRMRRNLVGDTPYSRCDALLDVDGRLIDARDDETASVREALRDAVKAVDRARKRDANDEDELPRWQGLVDGRWSLVDHFEGSGRRYYVAVKNPPNAEPIRKLSERERGVIGYTLRGTSQKIGAYALGMAPSNYSRTLRSGMAKLGVRTVPALMELGERLTSGDMEPVDAVDASVTVMAADTPSFPATFTEAERGLAGILLEGPSNQEIAEARGSSIRTVANQLASMYAKIGVTTREELVAHLLGIDVDAPPPSALS